MIREQPLPILYNKRLPEVERQALCAWVKFQYEQAGWSIRALMESTGRSYGATHALLSEAAVTLRSRGSRGRGMDRRGTDDDPRLPSSLGKTQTARLAREIRERIHSGVYQPGQVLRRAELAEDLGVSVPSVDAAVTRLAR